MDILIADDHELFCALIKEVIEAKKIAAAVETCRSFNQALASVKRRRDSDGSDFNLILLDMNMPGMNGLSGLRTMMETTPKTPVAIISGSLKPPEAREVLREGAAGFLPKTMPLSELAVALGSLLAGERYLPQFLMADEAEESVTPKAARADRDDLTSREWEVLEELKQGWSNKQIADNLGISEITVKSHLMHLFRKLGARNRTDAVRIAYRLQKDGG